MFTRIRQVLLLALALGLCLSSASMATRICVVTLDTCCESAVEIAESEPDCCGEETTDCCLVVLSDEAVMMVPDGLFLMTLVPAPADSFTEGPRPLLSSSRELSRVPAPPPPTVRERLARLEIQLI